MASPRAADAGVREGILLLLAANPSYPLGVGDWTGVFVHVIVDGCC